MLACSARRKPLLKPVINIKKKKTLSKWDGRHTDVCSITEYWREISFLKNTHPLFRKKFFEYSWMVLWMKTIFNRGWNKEELRMKQE